MFRAENNTRPSRPEPVVRPASNPTTTQPENTPAAVTAKKADAQFFGATNKAKLERQYAANQPIPANALEQINALPKPAPTDAAAIREYKTQRGTIADRAIRDSQPPRIEDYRHSGLNGATANYEYQQSRTAYDAQVRDLNKISAEAAAYPDRILTPADASAEIERLPRPDRGNPQAIQDYNDRRAAIADAALMYSEPPTRADFQSLPGATGNYEYQQALTDYNSTVARLTEDANAGGTTILPVMSDAEATVAADDYLRAHNGVSNEEDGYAVGSDVAALAETDPEGAAAVMKKIQERLNSTDYGDNVASGFVQNSTVEEMRRVAQTTNGETVLRDLQQRLTTGNVHDGEEAEARKIERAIDPQAAGVMDAADRVEDVYGVEASRRLATELNGLDAEGQKSLMAELAQRDPQNFKSLLVEAGKENWMLAESGYQLSADEQRTIANALGAAYAAGALPSPDGQAMGEYLAYGTGYEAVQAVGNLLGEADGASSRSLKVAFATSALEAASGGDYFGPPHDAAAAALRAVSNDPTAIAEVFKPYQTGKVNDKSLSDILQMADGAGSTGGLPSVTAQFLDGARSLPVSENSLTMDIFKSYVRDMPDTFDGAYNSEKADALGRFFNSNKTFLTNELNDVNANPTDLQTFARFTELTVFNPDCTEAESVKTAIGDVAQTLRAEALKYDPNGTTAANDAAKAAARTLGTLTGNMFSGYFLRVQDIKEESEANKAMFKGLVDFALDFIPAGDLFKNATSEIIKKIGEKGVEMTMDQLSDAIVEAVFADGEQSAVENLQDFLNNVLIGLPEGEPKQEAVQNQRIALSLFGVYEYLGG